MQRSIAATSAAGFSIPSARWSRQGSRPDIRPATRAASSPRKRIWRTSLDPGAMRPAEIGEELIQPSVGQWMQEQGAQHVRRNGDRVGTCNGARAELRGIARKRRENVALDAVRREQLVHARDGIDTVVAL